MLKDRKMQKPMLRERDELYPSPQHWDKRQTASYRNVSIYVPTSYLFSIFGKPLRFLVAKAGVRTINRLFFVNEFVVRSGKPRDWSKCDNFKKGNFNTKLDG